MQQKMYLIDNPNVDLIMSSLERYNISCRDINFHAFYARFFENGSFNGFGGWVQIEGSDGVTDSYTGWFDAELFDIETGTFFHMYDLTEEAKDNAVTLFIGRSEFIKEAMMLGGSNYKNRFLVFNYTDEVINACNYDYEDFDPQNEEICNYWAKYHKSVMKRLGFDESFVGHPDDPEDFYSISYRIKDEIYHDDFYMG